MENVYYPYRLTTLAKSSIQEYTFSIGLVGVDLNLTGIINSEKTITVNSSGAIISQDANNEFYLRPVVVLDKDVQAIGLGINNEDNYYMLVS